MKLSVICQPALPASNSPYRVCDENGGEIEWANAFLAGQRLRQGAGEEFGAGAEKLGRLWIGASPIS